MALSKQIPRMFYLNGMLHMRIKIVNSDDSVVAWCYQEQNTKWYPRNEVRRNFKKAYTIQAAAALIRVSAARVKGVIDRGMVEIPEKAYDIATFRPGRYYISEENMLELRQVLWDLLPKNRLGIPHDDTMASEKELEHDMRLGDDREFVVLDGDIIRIFKA